MQKYALLSPWNIEFCFTVSFYMPCNCFLCRPQPQTLTTLWLLPCFQNGTNYSWQASITIDSAWIHKDSWNTFVATKVCCSEKRKNEIFSSRFSVFWRQDIRGLILSTRLLAYQLKRKKLNFHFGAKTQIVCWLLLFFGAKIHSSFHLSAKIQKVQQQFQLPKMTD